MENRVNSFVVKVEKLSGEEIKLVNNEDNVVVKCEFPEDVQQSSSFSTYSTKQKNEMSFARNQFWNNNGNTLFKQKERILNCKNCNMLFVDGAALLRHKKAKHVVRCVKKKHVCQHCNYSSDNSGNLKRHLMIHSQVKPNKCSVCGKSFSLKQSLARHMDIHLKKRYKCEICYKSFAEKSYVKKHKLSIHEGARSFVCTECGKRFKRSNHLTQHIKIHTSKRPCKCQHCNKRFSRASCLKAHIGFHTTNKPYKCVECSVAFTTLSNFSIHVITDHTRRFLHSKSMSHL